MNIYIIPILLWSITHSHTPTDTDTCRDTSEYHDVDLDHMARIISAEAIPGDMQDMIAVGTVVMNRVHSSEYPCSILGVIMQPRQFSGYLSDLYHRPGRIHYQAAIEVIELGSRSFGPEVLWYINRLHATDSRQVSRVDTYKRVRIHKLDGTTYQHEYYKL